MRFSDLLERTEAKALTQEAASEFVGVSVRTFQRWAERYEAEGDDGLVDGRLGRRSPRRAPEEELERMLGLYRDKYADFTVKHFHEQLQKRHGYVLGYTVTKLALQAAGLVRKAPKRSAHRKKRPRRPLPGMLLHQDGSRHAWIEGLPAMDLIVTLDDATSEIYSMLLVEEEGTALTCETLGEVIGERGLFCALYTDRGRHYFYTPKAGEKVSKTLQTQVGRALSHLGIEHIAAYSPEARGRSERMFGTLQGRLPKDLRLAGIRTVEAANAWLKAHYVVTSIAGHFCIDEFKVSSPLPVVDLISEVKRAIEQRGLKRIGILGTRTAMEKRFYGGVPSAQIIANGQDSDDIHQAYIDMATAGVVTEVQRRFSTLSVKSCSMKVEFRLSCSEGPILHWPSMKKMPVSHC